MSQHFLLSAAARTLSLASVARMSDEKAHETFMSLRWADNDGQPYCPFCGCLKVYTLTEKTPKWKCSACRTKFTVTAQTIFANRKMPIRDILLGVAIFANSAKGHSALQLSRDLKISYKSAFVLAHKIREALASETANMTIGGTGKVAEVDGAYFGKTRRRNKAEDRKDQRTAENVAKRSVVVVMRERGGRTLPFVVGKESDGAALIRERVESAPWFTLMRRRAGIAFTLPTICAASIIAWPTASMAPAPIKPSRSLAACGALRSARTTI